MKPLSSRLLPTTFVGLLIVALAAACGSEAERRKEPSAEGGAAGETAVNAAGSGDLPEPLAGRGGEGGTPSGNAGAPVVEGGAPAGAGGVAAGGEGGAETLPPVDCESITFDDSNLLSSVLNELDKLPGDPISTQEAAGITELIAAGAQLTSLAGIECLTGLVNVHLGTGGGPSQISDLAPLRYLKHLERVDLSENPLTDLTPLAGLPNLKWLGLYRVPGNLDLTQLAQAPKLEELELAGTNLADLTPLSEIASLSRLDLRSATLSQPASLSTLTNVIELDLAGALTDVTPLAGLTQLTHLELGSLTLTNTAELSSLSNLTFLDAYQAGLTSAQFVSSMPKLVSLNLSYNSIADLTPLTGLAQLSELSLSGNPFTDLTPLVDNAALATGDSLYLYSNTLTCNTSQQNLATLTGRGLTVYGLTCP